MGEGDGRAAVLATMRTQALLAEAAHRLTGSVNQRRCVRTMVEAELPAAHPATPRPRGDRGLPVRRCAGHRRGPGFGSDGRYAHRLGAAAWAARADAATDRFAAADWPPPVDASDQLHRHVAGEEYHRLVGRRPALIRDALAGLAERCPPVAGYDDRQVEATVEDLGHIVDFLAAALYVDDAAVFTESRSGRPGCSLPAAYPSARSRPATRCSASCCPMLRVPARSWDRAYDSCGERGRPGGPAGLGWYPVARRP